MIIPCYNRTDVLFECLSSVAAQTLKDFEVILVDDGSTDQPLAILQKFRDQFRFKFCRLDVNKGGAYARNAGIKEASGDYVAFLDSDDVWLPEKLEVVSSYISRSARPKETLFFTQTFIIRDGEPTRIRPDTGLRNGEKVLDYLFCKEGLIQTSTIVIARTLALETMFDTRIRFHNDYLFCVRVERTKAEFAMIQRPLSEWRCGDRNDRISLSSRVVDNQELFYELAGVNLSDRAKRAYYATHIIPRLGGWSKIPYLLLSLVTNSIGTHKFLKVIVRTYLPTYFSKYVAKRFQ
ncbi:glycosyltransferase family 2 protein [Rhizobium rhizoryzae]|uniref:glycosyltransferase family 2 protein n=1 Tax=Rhizobium rhizoryzae TaxID=451876 RepID=UPI003CCEAB1F